MKKSDLYREWARVLDMCEGTNVDPGLCWMCGGIGRNFSDTPVFTENPEQYSFAVAILEDKPVFVGDAVWNTRLNRFVEIEDDAHIRLLIDVGQAAWQPPKKTFTLNGEELPCPSKCGQYGFQLGIFATYCFETPEDCTKVLNSINKILKDATK